MNCTASPNLLSALKTALRKPPKVVSSFLQAGAANSVSGGGTTVVIGGAPAGGSSKGWWSNGVFLMFKDQAVACRPYGTRSLQVLETFAGMVSGSDLVQGLEMVSVSSLD